MKTIRLQNDFLTLDVSLLGAEMVALLKKDNTAVLWEKDNAIWNRTAPNLFPIVGRLKNDTYSYNGTPFPMKQHGFARDEVFELVFQNESELVLRLCHNERTIQFYPFEFQLDVCYQLTGATIKVTYTTTNLGEKPMLYSIGGHPGFHLANTLENYSLQFDAPFAAERWLIEDAYYSGKTELMEIQTSLELNDELFASDAIVFKNPPFKSVTLAHRNNGNCITISWERLDAIGFWTKKNAPFFCIEPWWGWADKHDSTGCFEEKEGLHQLAALESEHVGFSLRVH